MEKEQGRPLTLVDVVHTVSLEIEEMALERVEVLRDPRRTDSRFRAPATASPQLALTVSPVMQRARSESRNAAS